MPQKPYAVPYVDKNGKLRKPLVRDRKALDALRTRQAEHLARYNYQHLYFVLKAETKEKFTEILNKQNLNKRDFFEKIIDFYIKNYKE